MPALRGRVLFRNGSYDMELTSRLRLDFNVDAAHSTNISGLPGGGTDPNSLSTDTLFGTPSNSEPFEVTIPLNVTGPSSGIILRVLASSLVNLDFGQDPPPPAEPPGAAVDIRTVWDLYADMNADGVIDSEDILVNHEECEAREHSDLIGIRLTSVLVGAGRHVLKVRCVVDVRIRASIVDCAPAAVVGSPDLHTQLRLEVIPDSYGTP